MANTATYSLLTPEALQGLLETGGPFELLDVRTDGERRNIPFFDAKALEPDVEPEVAALPKDRPLVFICYRGVRSKTAAQKYAQLGFARVFSLDGGVEAYVKKLGRPPVAQLALSA